jgi:hypothetical protein
VPARSSSIVKPRPRTGRTPSIGRNVDVIPAVGLVSTVPSGRTVNISSDAPAIVSTVRVRACHAWTTAGPTDMRTGRPPHAPSCIGITMRLPFG